MSGSGAGCAQSLLTEPGATLDNQGPHRHPVLRTLASTFLASAMVLTVLVLSGRVQAADDRLRQYFRPDDVWGRAQLDATYVVDGLRPTRMLALLVVVTAIACARRRSFQPLLVVGVSGFVAVALLLGTKVVVARPDPHDYIGIGAYPSGHTLSIVLAVGLSIVLIAGTRAAGWAVAAAVAAGLVMGGALLLQAAHWASDVAGGALIAVAGVAWVGQSAWCARTLGEQPRNRSAPDNVVTTASRPCEPAGGTTDGG